MTAIAALGWAALAPAQDAVPREVDLEIIAGEDWAATGIEVRPGDRISIEAGEAPSPHGPKSPDGEPDPVAENVLEPRLPYAALIGRIGEGESFFVGARYKGRMSAAGPLRLRWNLIRRPIARFAEVFPTKVRHRPGRKVDKDRTDSADKKGGDKAPVDKAPVDEARVDEAPVEPVVEAPPPVAATPPATAKPVPARAVQPRPAAASSRWPWWLALGVAGAGAAGLALQRTGRARRVRRTRALLGLTPSLDLADGRCRGDDLALEGPSASLRARLEPGIAHMEEEGGHG
ncbi:MAG TPA: hypothetical protein VF547_02810 [Allosphingosinicella sp.]